MKILAPLRSAGEVEPLSRAGADEFYCGLTPPGWIEKFPQTWIHRRDPRAAGVADFDELSRIVALAGTRPVFATLNAPAYPPGSLKFLTAFGRHLLEATGVSALVVADLDLLLTLADQGFADQIHVSSLATCTNPGSAMFFRDLGVSRVIVPRHLTLAEIEAVATVDVEIEAFLLNDGCVFEEGLCATTHAAGAFCLDDGKGTHGLAPRILEIYEFWKWTLNNCGCTTNRGYQLGPCGLCALPRLRAAGVASLKVVGREAALDRKVGSVRLASRARDMALAGAQPEEIREAVIGLRGGRSLCEDAHLCYYPGLWREEPRAIRAEEVVC